MPVDFSWSASQRCEGFRDKATNHLTIHAIWQPALMCIGSAVAISGVLKLNHHVVRDEIQIELGLALPRSGIS